MKNQFLNISLILVFAISACVTNTEDTTSTGGPADPPPIEDVQYASQVQTIFNNSCGGGACHTSGGSASGVNLASYAQTVGSVGARYGTNVVLPNNAVNSPLIDKLEANPRFGSRMPLGRSPLTNEQIEIIRVWINEGANDN